MPAIVPVAMAVMAVATVAQTMNQMDAAKKTAALENQRLELQRRQQQLDEAKQEAILQRQSRAARSKITNTAAAGGALTSSSAAGAISAVGASQARELGYLKQGLDLSMSADDVTRQQISLNEHYTENNAIFTGIKGLASIAMDGFGGGGAQTAGGITSSFQSGGGSAGNVQFNSFVTDGPRD